MEECRDEFDQESNPEERIRIVCSKSESLKVSDVVHREDAWPRKNEELSKRNREDGNQAESRTRFLEFSGTESWTFYQTLTGIRIICKPH